MEKEILSCELVETIGEYTIIKTKESIIDIKHKQTVIWYDVCLDNGDGDIVYSSKNLYDARKWAKEDQNGC